MSLLRDRLYVIAQDSRQLGRGLLRINAAVQRRSTSDPIGEGRLQRDLRKPKLVGIERDAKRVNVMLERGGFVHVPKQRRDGFQALAALPGRA